jgi:MYXO-CTERM domain-containing protein
MSRRWLIACAVGLALLVPRGDLRAAPNAVGLNTHLPQNDVLDAAVAAGVEWVRIDFNWYIAQPSAGKAPDFSLFEKVIDAAQKRGLKVFPSISYSPAWAGGADTDGITTNNAPKPGLYRIFTEQAAKHFKGKITHWGLWNEANLDHFFDGTMQQYVDNVLLEGFAGIKAGCPSCKILGPEFATVGKTHEAWTTASLAALKKAGLMFDIITWHIYGGFLETQPGWQCWDGDLFVHDLDERRACLGFPVGTTPLRELLKAQNLQHLEVWLTETGYRAPIGTAKEATQKTYYRRVLEEQLKRPWWSTTFFYEIVDDNNFPDKWGITTRKSGAATWPADYQKKPAFDLLAKALKNQPAFGGTGGDCNDGLDNDGDGKIDFPQDPDCSSASDKTEGKALPPDAGPPPQDAGAADASSPRDAGVATDTGTTQPDAAPAGDAGALDASRDQGRRDGGAAGSGDDGGCAVSRGGDAGAGAGALLLLLLFVVVRRRPPGQG